MYEFFIIATTLPAAPFGVLTLLSVAWWVVAVVSGFDGAAEGTVDAAVDGALTGAADGALEGALDAAGAEGPPPLTGVMTRYVPITAWLALFSVWGWIASFTFSWSLRHLIVGWVPAPVGSFGGIVLAAIVASFMTRLTSRPLAPLFQNQPARLQKSLIGEIAEITTSRVDARFGQARWQVGSEDLVIQVRCDRTDNALSRGHRALVVGFDSKRDAFVVEPAHDISNFPEA